MVTGMHLAGPIRTSQSEISGYSTMPVQARVMIKRNLFASLSVTELRRISKKPITLGDKIALYIGHYAEECLLDTFTSKT
jgi:hypothetical protein